MEILLIFKSLALVPVYRIFMKILNLKVKEDDVLFRVSLCSPLFYLACFAFQPLTLLFLNIVNNIYDLIWNLINFTSICIDLVIVFISH